MALRAFNMDPETMTLFASRVTSARIVPEDCIDVLAMDSRITVAGKPAQEEGA